MAKVKGYTRKDGTKVKGHTRGTGKSTKRKRRPLKERQAAWAKQNRVWKNAAKRKASKRKSKVKRRRTTPRIRIKTEGGGYVTAPG